MSRWIAAYILAIAISAAGIWSASLFPLNCDVSFIADATQRMLNGEAWYRDNLNANTPFIMYYILPPVLLARTGLISFPTAFFLFAGLILTGCALLSLWVLSRNPRYQSTLHIAALAVFLPLLVFFYRDFEVCSSFGQRENLFFALFLPYVLLALNMLDGVAMPRRMRWVIGACALVGCTIKPHFIVFYGLSELYLMWRLKHWRIVLRPESAVVLIGFPAAHALILLLFPEYISQLKLMMFLYQGQRKTVTQFLSGFAGDYFAPVICIVAIWMMLWRAGAAVRQRGILRDAGYISMLVAAGFFHFALHRTLYPYQALPMMGFFYLLCMYVLLHVSLANKNEKYFLVSVLAGIALVFPLPLHAASIAEAYRQYPKERQMWDSLHERFGGKSMMMLSTALYPVFPAAMYADIHNVATVANLIFIPPFYTDQRVAAITSKMLQTHYHRPDDMLPLERHFFEVTIKDILVKKPDLLFVDMSRRKQDFGRLHFDLLDYFGQDSQFREAMRHYRRVTSPWDQGNAFGQVIAIYQRIPD